MRFQAQHSAIRTPRGPAFATAANVGQGFRLRSAVCGAHPRAMRSGGAGFIGSHLADERLRSGYRVRAIDVVSAHERDPKVDLAGLRAAVASGRVDPSPLDTQTYPLEHLGDAPTPTKDRPDGFLIALVILIALVMM
jgi:hypothetical protein